MDLFGELTWRGLVYDATEGLREAIAAGPLTLYAGFDATADSLHVGHLLPALGLARWQRHGHHPIALVGGGTGLIGDPSGKSAERALLTVEQVESNAAAIRVQLERILDFGAAGNPARLLNNADWLTAMSAMAFLRDVGKHFSVNAMLARESVKRRLEGEEGISYTEFSYALLQASDYRVLHERFGCSVQIGGSDQWGNILSGCDLIRRVTGKKAHGMVMPLLTTASGAKFGKTEAGAVWLDAERTSPYEFYQFWVNADDREVVTYLKFFTFLAREQIAELESAVRAAPERREAQRELAREVTRLVHGPGAVAAAEAAAGKLFGGDLRAMTEAELLQAFGSAPAVDAAWPEGDWPVRDFLAATGITASKGEAVRLLKGGGIYVNDQRVADEKQALARSQALCGRFFVVRKGKRDNVLVRVSGD